MTMTSKNLTTSETFADVPPSDGCVRRSRTKSRIGWAALVLVSSFGSVSGFAASRQLQQAASASMGPSKGFRSCRSPAFISFAATDDFLFVDATPSDPLTQLQQHWPKLDPEEAVVLSEEPAEEDSKSISLEDNNGKPIHEGDVVRIIAPNAKAYHVPAKFHGYFDEDGSFVSTPKEEERGKRCLQVPIGLQGVVLRLYDVDDISANHPIRVKFVPGEHTEEKEAPTTFIMHFSQDEVELVEK